MRSKFTELRSLRIPRALLQLVDDRARAFDASFTDVVVEALAAWMGRHVDGQLALLDAVARHALERYRDDFPPDVIRLVFLEIRDNPQLRALYDRVAGEPRSAQRDALNQRVANAVTRVLGGSFSEISETNNPDELVESYAVLMNVPY